MKNYKFLDKKGTFYLENPENTGYLYFPIAGEQGIKGSVTPNLGGDLKMGQNEFILQPVSAEDLHNNKSGRNFWCNIENQGVWSATGASAGQMELRFTDMQEKSSLEAGIMWHQVQRESPKYKLRSKITSFVPVSELQVEIMHVEICNLAQEAVTLIPTAAVPIYGRSADNIRDHRHVTSLLHHIRTTEEGVFVTPTLSFDERGHRENQVTYFVCGVTGDGEKPTGYYPVVETYIGEGGSFERPEAVVRDLPTEGAGMTVEGYEAMGGLQFAPVTLSFMESKTYTIIIGAAYKEKNMGNVTIDYDTDAKVQLQLEITKHYWDEKCNVTYHTADDRFDNIMYWVNFQPMLRRIYGCSFLPHHDYGKGGRGWRDLWQDCLALLMMNPKVVKEMLVNNFAGVRMDGTNATIIGNQPGEFIADRNNITRVWMDHGVWPLMTTKLYIDQTGDISILLKENNYFKDKQVVRGTETDELWEEPQGPVLLDQENQPYYGSVLEHLLLENLTAFYEVGIHNHIRLRDADWNDALDMAPEKGESVAFTAAYAKNLTDLAELIEILQQEKQETSIAVAKEMEVLLKDDIELYDSVDKKEKLLKEYCKSCLHRVSGEKRLLSCGQVMESLRSKADWIKKHIRETEWITTADGHGWFNGYYDNSGNAVEGEFETGIRMMLTSQVFTIMSGTATEKQVADIVAAADKYLYQKEKGGYRLNTDFQEIKMNLGRMFGFAYGHKENGAVFSHMTTMYANALYQRGFVKEGHKAIASLYEQAANFEVSRIYPGIPEYFNVEGRGMYHYLTGAASWMMITVITGMFGVKGKLGALCLEPKLRKEQFDPSGEIGIELHFGNRKWYITYVNADGLDYGEYQIDSMQLDGKKTDAKGQAVIPLETIEKLKEDEVHKVIVVLGKKDKE